MTTQLEVPTMELKEPIHSLKVIYESTTGISCPRCGGSNFNKRGQYNYKGKRLPRKLCRDCGYVFSIVDPQTDGFTRNRGSRIFNLDNKKVDNLLEDAIQFGLIRKTQDGVYSRATSTPATKTTLYHNIPIYHYLIETVGYNLQRRVFEDALKSNPDKCLASLSQIKRDTLWRRYQEIAVEIFVCEKTCNFSRTCKKSPNDCMVVKRTREKKPVWRVDIEI